MDASRSQWLILSCSSRDDGNDFGKRLSRSLDEARTVLPLERIVVVALESESPWWAPLVAHLPQENVVEEPIDRGSAIGVLIAVLRILERDPSAEVIVANVDGRRGAIVCRASSRAFLDLFREAQPALLSEVIHHLEQDEGSLDNLYPFLPSVDLERDVLGFGYHAASSRIPTETRASASDVAIRGMELAHEMRHASAHGGTLR